MNLNATFFVQIFLFIIGYYLISRLFLKPGYQVLKQENDYQEQLQGLLNHEQDILVQQRAENKKNWQACKAEFRGQMPDTQMHIESSKSAESLEIISPSSEKISELEEHIVATLKKHILSEQQ